MSDGRWVVIDGREVEVKTIVNERGLCKDLSYLLVIGKCGEDVAGKAIREYFMEFGMYPRVILECSIRDVVKVFLPVMEMEA